ncbi:hypothetical protein [Singulisphaera acidiphila]|uniref:Uncharacterized protein n=1 Tax=Singulisphaera acidiphila (strain ATCC BAA-1392 / DSM 18658 / VKM B-2454 / MOB10) TaxID=886293 RepID=L0DMZ0_SINAD|nr:hypothetical protein [Singulisphaera acidiphila]AGA30749.1 hypothetical protein Sinac_6675 [Singulisphaera acidiphila DSM 18658]
MRNVFNGVIWFTLISGAFFAVASQAERPNERPHLEAGREIAEGHPKDCLACKNRGRGLPAEIDEYTVWLVKDDGSARR